MDVRQFENNRWRKGNQLKVFRHRACLELVKGRSALDFGCGDGLMLGLLKNKGMSVAGIDMSDEAVRKCSAKGFDVKLDSLDKRLPYHDGEFDSVIGLDVLEHLYDPSSTLVEAARVAAKHVIIGVPNFSSLPARLQTLRGAVPENNRPHKGHVYWFNWKVLSDMAAANGLQIIGFRVNTFFPLSILGQLGTAIARLWPNLLALSFVVSLEKSR